MAALVCLLSTSLFAGCALPKYNPGVPLHDRDLRVRLTSQLPEPVTSAVRLTHRLLVRTGDRVFDMIGYLYLEPDGSWKAIALGDMGVEMFRLEFHDGHGEVISKPDRIPLKPISRGIIRDIQHVFGLRSASKAHLVQRGGAVALVLVNHGRRHCEYQFSEGGGYLTKSMEVFDGKIVRQVAYSESTSLKDLARGIPQDFVLQNHRWGYTLEAVLLEVKDRK